MTIVATRNSKADEYNLNINLSILLSQRSELCIVTKYTSSITSNRIAIKKKLRSIYDQKSKKKNLKLIKSIIIHFNLAPRWIQIIFDETGFAVSHLKIKNSFRFRNNLI